MQLRIAHQSSGFDGGCLDRIGGEFVPKDREHSRIASPSEPDERLRSCVVILIVETRGQRVP